MPVGIFACYMHLFWLVHLIFLVNVSFTINKLLYHISFSFPSSCDYCNLPTLVKQSYVNCALYVFRNKRCLTTIRNSVYVQSWQHKCMKTHSLSSLTKQSIAANAERTMLLWAVPQLRHNCYWVTERKQSGRPTGRQAFRHAGRETGRLEGVTVLLVLFACCAE